MIVKGKLPFPISDSLIGFDAEWTKNYKIKNGNVPFFYSSCEKKKYYNGTFSKWKYPI